MDYTDIQWKDMTDTDFHIWMRTAGLPDFRKLWGKIAPGDLSTKGQYRIQIDSNFETSKWEGQKKFVVSTN